MRLMNISKEDIDKALEITNKVFNNNIVYKRFESGKRGMSHTVSLTVDKSDKPGGRRSAWLTRKDGEPKRVHSACWHVFGVFFDAVFLTQPNCRIRSNGSIITKNEGNWEDRNIGSYFQPVQYSEACECNYDYGLLQSIDDVKALAEQKAEV